MCKIIFLIILLLTLILPAWASYLPTTGISNIGIGTTTPQALLSIIGGNVGIGTWTAGGGNLIINGGGNVGIGSAWPGTTLDVNGTLRMTGLTMSGQTPMNGYVLTASDSSGDTTWSSPGLFNSTVWINTNNNIYNPNSGNVGINTTNGSNVGIGTSIPQGALVVTNGNVGIGTWSPGNSLDVVGGNIGIGTGSGYGLVGIGTTSTIFAVRKYDTTGIYVGWQAGAGETTASSTMAVLGSFADRKNDTGGAAFGYGALENMTTNGATGVGYQALTTATTGIGSATGYNALSNITTGSHNVAFGYQAGEFISGGSTNNTTSQHSTYIGYDAYPLTNGDTDETAIGANAVGIGSYTVEIGNSTTVATQIQGNLGIGTFNPFGGNLIVDNVTTPGNVGIGSLVPGQALDVHGTVRMTGLTMSGSSPANGYVMTATDSAGDATWSAPGTFVVWSAVGSNIYNTNSGNVGINTTNGSNVGIGTSTPQGALVVVNGNVGIATWSPAGLFQINNPAASPFVVTSGGNAGIGTTTPQGAFVVTSGNVGIGTWSPGSLLVTGKGTDDFSGSTALLVPTSSGAAPTANGSLAFDSTQERWASGGNGTVTGYFPRVVFVDNATNTAGNQLVCSTIGANTETAFASQWTVPSGFMVQNKVIRVTGIFDVASAGAGGTKYETRMRWGGVGGTIIADGGQASASASSDIGAHLQWTLQGTGAAGASVNIEEGRIARGDNNNYFGSQETIQSPVAVTTNASETLVLTFTCTTNTAGFSETLRQLVVEELN